MLPQVLRKKNGSRSPEPLRRRFLSQGREEGWPVKMMAETLGITLMSLKRWMKRHEQMAATQAVRGRPEVIPPHARWKLRQCYLAHYGQWGPSVLRCWAIREGLGTWSTGAIARVIADLKPAPAEKRQSPRKYEVAAPMVMWSEDGTAIRDRSRKRELLVLQDECARHKTNWRLAYGAAQASDVLGYLREAFEQHGAPLVLKHDGGSIFHDTDVKALLDQYGVVELTSPPGYPPFNGKKERSMRDIKSFERALRQNGVGTSLEERIVLSMRDLNDERPRPVLGGRTAREVFEARHVSLPNRRQFKMHVETITPEFTAQAGSRKEVENARRKAVIEVLSKYGLLKWKGNVSTNSRSKMVTY
jgi:transposase InsO family protein